MRTSYYQSSVSEFLLASTDSILGQLSAHHGHALEHLQRNAWLSQIDQLKRELTGVDNGMLLFEFIIPRMGKRADVVLAIDGVIFVLEFKVGATSFDRASIEQVHDYVLDLKNFHLGSHDKPIVPILVATNAVGSSIEPHWDSDGIARPLCVGAHQIRDVIARCLGQAAKDPSFEVEDWCNSGYRPTPTIIEAAEALYRHHSVEEIARSDAGAKNLSATSNRIASIIEEAKRTGTKAICFVTGVPGAGKTLSGLNIAAKRAERHQDEHAVFLSGNGPLVDVLVEALSRDQASREEVSKAEARRSVKRFVQNIHHFRDHYVGSQEVPFEKVVVFDEAQRAWTKEQAAKFMQQKRGHIGFNMSEPEFLISVMDRHHDWCCVVCLIGGGQEINTGEAGIGEWLTAIEERFDKWTVHASNVLSDRHYTIDRRAREQLRRSSVALHDDLHLAVSMRSFRAEQLSGFVSSVLDNSPHEARRIYAALEGKFELVLSRDLDQARDWLRERARGSERFGLVASSGAYRLRADGLHVRAGIDPTSWFL